MDNRSTYKEVLACVKKDGGLFVLQCANCKKGLFGMRARDVVYLALNSYWEADGDVLCHQCILLAIKKVTARAK